MADRYVSVSAELEEVQLAVAAAGLVFDSLQDVVDGNSIEAKNRAASGTAVLNIVKARLRLLTQALRNDVDPATLLEPYNRVEGVRIELDVPDLRLAPWPPQEVAEKAREAFRRAEARERQGTT